jgi:hypothetical protein
LTDIGGEIGLNEDGGRVLDANCARDDEQLANRIRIGLSTGVLACQTDA